MWKWENVEMWKCGTRIVMMVMIDYDFNVEDENPRRWRDKLWRCGNGKWDHKMINERNDEECDARDDDSSTVDWKIKNIAR